MHRYAEAAQAAIDRCLAIAAHSEDSERTTRTFLSPPMRRVHDELRVWMASLGMSVRIDNAGNLRGTTGAGPTVLLGSHLDTVPGAGAYDGVLGVVIGITLVELLAGQSLPVQLEVIGFSEEEGVRFGVPFIGSRALVGDADALLEHTDRNGCSVRTALEAYGLDPDNLGDAHASPQAVAYLEFHIEQGPVLDRLAAPLAVVETIAGQSRLALTFTGHANHAGTTPMAMRHDALAGAAEWVSLVEQMAVATPGLVATVGRIEASPNVGNAINGQVVASLDVRHAEDRARHDAVEHLLDAARAVAGRRGLAVSHTQHLDQAAVPMERQLTGALARAVSATGQAVHRMTSGAGHDAMIVARRIPAAMLFLRSPGGISHHPNEQVLVDDVAAALEVGVQLLTHLLPAIVAAETGGSALRARPDGDIRHA
jgi:allantoate deiminase